MVRFFGRKDKAKEPSPDKAQDKAQDKSQDKAQERAKTPEAAPARADALQPRAAESAKSVGRLLRVSPQKLNLVARSIRGLKVEKALNQLQFSSRRIAGAAKKVLESAIANAENNHALNIDDLVVAEAYVGKNMVLRRWRPRARGRAAPIRKPFSQLTIIVKEAPAEDEPKAKSGRRRAGAAGESPSAQSPTAGALTASAPTAGGEGKG